MSVETTDRKVTHEMDELLTEYAFTFRALVTAPSDIKAIIRNSVTGVSEDMEYVEDLPEEPTEDDRLKYTVAVNDDGIGGVVELAWASDDTNELTIYRETTDIQSSAYEDYNQFPASTVESDFDRRTMVTQEINETIDRAIRLPITTDADTEMPEPVADAFIGWNSDGDALENKELPDPSTLVKATQEDAEAGTNNDKFMTPLRTKEAIDALVVPVTVVDSLISTSSTSALSANQGKILKDLIDVIPSEITHLIVNDTKASNTAGGTFTSGAWRTRDLNTEVYNTISGASLAINQITLPAGTYLINASAPAYYVGKHKIKLRNITDSEDTLIGSTEYSSYSAGYAMTRSFIIGSFAIASAKVFEIQHQCSNTLSTSGFGDVNNFSVDEIYTQVHITKVG